MTNREVLRAPEELLDALDRQRLFVLRIDLTPMPCPACKRPVNALNAAGIDVDAFDFGVTKYEYRCSACKAELEQVVPFIAGGGHLWHWQLKHRWLQEQLRKAKAFDRQRPTNQGSSPT